MLHSVLLLLLRFDATSSRRVTTLMSEKERKEVCLCVCVCVLNELRATASVYLSKFMNSLFRFGLFCLHNAKIINIYTFCLFRITCDVSIAHR